MTHFHEQLLNSIRNRGMYVVKREEQGQCSYWLYNKFMVRTVQIESGTWEAILPELELHTRTQTGTATLYIYL